jgi:hypothetical protein
MLSDVVVSKRVCVYCGGAGTTRDHVPARQLFPVALRKNLLSVPCCKKCNKDFKADEDYFRALVACGPAIRGPAADDQWRACLRRGFSKDAGLRRTIQRAVRHLPRVTPAGLLLAPVPAVEIDWKRLERVAAKWVRALYYHEYGEPLACAATVQTSGVDPARPAFPLWVGRQTVPGRAGWPLVFQYRHGRDNHEHSRSLWYFRVLESYDFIGMSSEAPAARVSSGTSSLA